MMCILLMMLNILPMTFTQPTHSKLLPLSNKQLLPLSSNLDYEGLSAFVCHPEHFLRVYNPTLYSSLRHVSQLTTLTITPCRLTLYPVILTSFPFEKHCRLQHLRKCIGVLTGDTFYTIQIGFQIVCNIIELLERFVVAFHSRM